MISLKYGDSSVSFQLPDTHTTILRDHLRKENHFGTEHTDENCGKSYKWRTAEDISDSLTEAIHENNGSTAIPQKISKKHENINDNSLFNLPLKNHKFPIHHGKTGVLENGIKMMGEDAKKLYEENNKVNIKEAEVHLKSLIVDKEKKLEFIRSDIKSLNNEERQIKNSINRHKALLSNNFDELEAVAYDYWPNEAADEIYDDVIDPCGDYCILQSIDKKLEGDPTLVCCNCKENRHMRCEGILMHEESFLYNGCLKNISL